MTESETILVPPDGGWGWMVVLAISIIQLNTRSMEQCFGLVFGDMLDNLGVKTTGATAITSTMDILINFSGIFTGPLIRKYSYRKVTMLGSILVGAGLILTSFTTSVAQIIVTYSILNGLGAGLTTSATFVALNRYFVKKRGKAFGYSIAGAAVGTVVIPQIVQILLFHYGFRGTILIIGGFSLHAIAGTLLLQPAEWHYIPQETETVKKPMETITEEDDEEEVQTKKLLKADLGEINKSTNESTFKDVDRFQNKFRKSASMKSFENTKIKPSSSDQSLKIYGQMDLTGSTTFLNFESADELKIVKSRRRHHSVPAIGVGMRPERTIKEFVQIQEIKKINQKKESLWMKIYNFMDFDILRDPIYCSLVFGLSLFYAAEGNFKTVIAFYLRNLNYDQQNVATFLSVHFSADIVARIIFPIFMDKFKFTKREFFWIGLFLLAVARSIVALCSDFVPLILAFSLAGFIRGYTFINFLITITEVVTPEKIAAAFGLHMVIRGVFVIILGLPLGYIRDVTDSYQVCLFLQSLLLMIAFVVWGIEFIIRRNKIKSSKVVENV